MKNKIFKSLKYILSIIITIVCFYFIFNAIDIDLFLTTLYSVDIKFYIISLIFVILGVFVQSYRLHNFLAIKDSSYLYIVKITFVSYFFNNFFLSFLGGDAYRVYKLNRLCKMKESINSIIFVRLTNLFSLFLFLIVLFWYSIELKETYIEESLKYLAIFSWIFFIFLIFLSLFKEQYKKYISLIVSGIIFQMLVILTHYYLIDTLHLDLTLMDIFVIVPAILIVTALPISFNGIGIREVSFIYGLGYLGINSSEALIFSMFSYSFGIFNSVVGGLVYLIDKKEEKQI